MTKIKLLLYVFMLFSLTNTLEAVGLKSEINKEDKLLPEYDVFKNKLKNKYPGDEECDIMLKIIKIYHLDKIFFTYEDTIIFNNDAYKCRSEIIEKLKDRDIEFEYEDILKKQW